MASNVNDILLENDFNPIIRGGDFVIGDATLQNQKLLMLAEPGDYRQHPTTGVGIINYLNDEDGLVQLQGDIQKEFEADGMKVKKLKVDSLTSIEVEAHYE